jgi:hypothetical protein
MLRPRLTPFAPLPSERGTLSHVRETRDDREAHAADRVQRRQEKWAPEAAKPGRGMRLVAAKGGTSLPKPSMPFGRP